MARITITGMEKVVHDLEALPMKIAAAFASYARANEGKWLDLLKGTIQTVVYDVYNPSEYKRNFNLLEAASVHTSHYASGVSRGSVTDLFNDSSKVRYGRRSDGSAGPRGGSRPQDVPWEIELGDWPTDWYGYVFPRPAYRMTARFLRPRIEAEADEIVGQVVRGG